MPKTATTSTPSQQRERPTNASARETAERADGRGQTPEEKARPHSPQEFYAELTKRPEMRAFLKRLADR